MTGERSVTNRTGGIALPSDFIRIGDENGPPAADAGYNCACRLGHVCYMLYVMLHTGT